MRNIKIKVLSIILAVSVIANLCLVTVLYSANRINGSQYSAYTLAVALLIQSKENAAMAVSGKDVINSLSLARELMSESNGIFRGLNAVRGVNASKTNNNQVDFTLLVDALQADLGLPPIHTGDYSQKELNNIEAAERKLQVILNSLKDTKYNNQGLPNLRERVKRMNETIKTWGWD